MGYRTYTCPTARRCGGCEWLAVPYPLQLRRKQELVEELLGEAVTKDGGELAEIAGMTEPVAYRHKCASPFAPGKGGALRCGFFAEGSHRIVACESCLVERPLGRELINAVARRARELGISAYHEDDGTGCLRHAIVRCGFATDEALLTLVTNGWALPRRRELASSLMGEFPQLVGVVQNCNAKRGNAILGPECRTLRGSSTMHDELLGCRFEIGATSFYQTNPAQTEVLYRLALDGLGIGGDRQDGRRDVSAIPDAPEGAPPRVLDAYCGCGTIGICAAVAARGAGHGIEVLGVERVGAAVSLARRNAGANDVADRCTFVCADATAHMRRLGGSDAFEAVIMDPPRAGATNEFLAALCGMAPQRVVYVSCNVQTQARDLAILRQGGYRVSTLTPVDLFPHTRHVETVAVLEHR